MSDLIWTDPEAEFVAGIDGSDRLDFVEMQAELDRSLPLCPANNQARRFLQQAALHAYAEGARTFRDLWDFYSEIVEGGEKGDRFCESIGMKTGSQRAGEKARHEAQQRALLGRPRSRLVFNGHTYKEIFDDNEDEVERIGPRMNVIPSKASIRARQEKERLRAKERAAKEAELEADARRREQAQRQRGERIIRVNGIRVRASDGKIVEQ